MSNNDNFFIDVDWFLYFLSFRLNNLYNVFPTVSKFRYNVFLSILNFAIETDNTKILIPVLPQLKSLLEQWNSTPEQKQTIYKSVCDLYKKNNPSSLVYYESLKVYLKTFEETKNEISEAIPSSVEAAVLAIKLDSIHQCDDLLELKAIEQVSMNQLNIIFCHIYF